MDENKELLARKAAEASQARQKLHVAKIEMMKHISSYIGYCENLRALTDIIAEQKEVDPKALWDWVKSEVFP